MKQDHFFENTYNNRYSEVKKSQSLSHSIRGPVDQLRQSSIVTKQNKLKRMYAFPASYKQALIHDVALQNGYKNRILTNGELVPRCPCCQNIPSTIKTNLTSSTAPKEPKQGENTFLIPANVAFYLSFIRMIIIYLSLRFFIFDIFNIIFSMSGSYCSNLIVAKSNHPCLYTISGYNLKSAIDQNRIDILDVLALAFTILSIVYFILYRRYLFRMSQWLDFCEISQDDFTILIQNVPKFMFRETTKKKKIDFKYKGKIKRRVEEIILDWLQNVVRYKSKEDCKDSIEQDFWNNIVRRKQDQNGNPNQNLIFYDQIVTSVNLCYNLTQIQNINSLREELIDEYLEEYSETQQESFTKHSDLISFIPNQIDVLNQEYISLCEQFGLGNIPAFNISNFSGKAFVSFQYQHYRDFFINKYQNDEDFFKIGKKRIDISKANRPSDIFWFNMKISKSQRTKNVLYSAVILIMILVISFAGFLGLKYWGLSRQRQVNANSLASKLSGYLVSATMAIVSNIVNYILSSSITTLTESEKHKTQSAKATSLILKLVISQTVNTSLIYSILYLLVPLSPLASLGLVSQVNSLIVVSGLISIALQVFLPFVYLFRWIDLRSIDKDKQINLFQIQLNNKIAKPSFDLAKMYSFYLIYTYVCSFYGFLVPTATPILIAIFFVEYWVDKYNLFRRFSKPAPFDIAHTRMMIKAFQVSVLFFALGYYIWSSTARIGAVSIFTYVNILNLVLTTIFISLSLLLPHTLKKKIFKESQLAFERLPYTYYLKQRTFSKRYFSQNPATNCLSQAQVNKGYCEEVVGEIPVGQFICDHQCDKYLNLKDEEKEVRKYQDFDVKVYHHIKDSEFEYEENKVGYNIREKIRVTKKTVRTSVIQDDD